MQTDRENIKKKKNKNSLRLAVIVLVFTCVGAGLIFADTYFGRGIVRGYVTSILQSGGENGNTASAETMSVEGDGRSSFAVFQEGFLLSTKDGVKFFESMNHRTWNDTFNMSSPQLVKEGEYAAVGDMSGNSVRVYDAEGIVYSVQTDGSVMQFALNENGYLSVISKEKNGAYRIQIFNGSGTLLKGRVEESDGVYPLCCDISDDNRSFAVSYMDTTNIEPMGKVVFFYINPEDSEAYTDSMFAAVEKNDQIIPVIAYMNGGILAVVGDSGIYGVSSEGNERWTYELKNMLEQVSVSNKDYIVAALGEDISGGEGRSEGTICWINNGGSEKAAYESGEAVTYLSSSKEGVIFGNDRDFCGVKNSGRPVWSYHSVAEAKELLAMKDLSTVLVVTNAEASVIDMKGTASVKYEETALDDNEDSIAPADGEAPDKGEEAAGAGADTPNAGEGTSAPEENS